MVNQKWNSVLAVGCTFGEKWEKSGTLPVLCTAPPHSKKFGVLLWGCMTFNGVGTLAFVDGNTNGSTCEDILD